MINRRAKNFPYKHYIFDVQKSLGDMFSRMKNFKSTCSISSDFINQFLIFEKEAEKILKKAEMYINFVPVRNMVSEILVKRCEILKDTKKIEKFCSNFKNCSVGIKNYRSEFDRICGDYSITLKNIGNIGNVNVFFLRFMIEYNSFSVLLIQNALKYRICPQLRLISEYCILSAKRENIKMKDILSFIK